MDEHLVLSVWADQTHVADITYHARQDAWSLKYSPAWYRRADSVAHESMSTYA